MELFIFIMEQSKIKTKETKYNQQIMFICVLVEKFIHKFITTINKIKHQC